MEVEGGERRGDSGEMDAGSVESSLWTVMLLR